MFDIGWPELFLVAVVTLIVVGPKELPRVLRTVTYWARKARGVAGEFQRSLEEMAREAELDEIRRGLESTASRDLDDEMERTLDPTGSVGDMFKGDPLREAEAPPAPAPRTDKSQPQAEAAPEPADEQADEAKA